MILLNIDLRTMYLHKNSHLKKEVKAKPNYEYNILIFYLIIY